MACESARLSSCHQSPYAERQGPDDIFSVNFESINGEAVHFTALAAPKTLEGGRTCRISLTLMCRVSSSSSSSFSSSCFSSAGSVAPLSPQMSSPSKSLLMRSVRSSCRICKELSDFGRTADRRRDCPCRINTGKVYCCAPVWQYIHEIWLHKVCAEHSFVLKYLQRVMARRILPTVCPSSVSRRNQPSLFVASTPCRCYPSASSCSSL